MSVRPSHAVVIAAVAVIALVVAGCGDADVVVGGPSDSIDQPTDSTSSTSSTDPTDSTDSTGSPGSTRVLFPPPAEVLDATVVYFDADGAYGPHPPSPLGAIVDDSGLRTFASRHVDGDPELGTAAADALAEGKILIGGPVSTGCFTSESGQVVYFDEDVSLLPVGLDEDPDVDCVRAVTSVVLMAIDPADIPDGATIQGIER